MNTRHSIRPGFTLIEVLMVIAIIGLLIGLLVPAVNIAFTTVRKRALAMEVITLADAVEKYQAKYGDYPPDGSNASVLQRHCRKVFPQIAASEFADLDFAVACNQAPLPWPGSTADPRVMDPTEALVFFLGGFSDDPVHPFTGPGGPLQVTARNSNGAATAVQYNVDRNAPLYEFKQEQLTLEVVSGLTVSTDETIYALSGGNDAVPAYRPAGYEAPYVYFDSRTYSFATPNGVYANHFSPGGTAAGFARPYKTNSVNTSVMYSAATADQYYRYANDDTFQIISAGIDDDFGGLNPLDRPTEFFMFPTGQLIDISIQPGTSQPGPLAYQTGDGPSPQLDNVTNFSEGILEDSIE